VKEMMWVLQSPSWVLQLPKQLCGQNKSCKTQDKSHKTQVVSPNWKRQFFCHSDIDMCDNITIWGQCCKIVHFEVWNRVWSMNSSLLQKKPTILVGIFEVHLIWFIIVHVIHEWFCSNQPVYAGGWLKVDADSVCF
jgi:hypothetical protein